MYGLPKDRLYVTYFEGDSKNGLQPDLEAKQYWLDQGVPEDHILPGNAKDNFWGMSPLINSVRAQLNSPLRNGCYRSMRAVQVRLLCSTLV